MVHHLRCACGAEPAYTRRYSGQSLCSSCFSTSIEKKAARTMAGRSMVRRGQRVAAAVSGGKDSLALLRVLEPMAGRGGFELCAVTIDEGIPGYREESLKIASEYCRSLGVDHRVFSYQELFGTTLDEALAGRSEKISACAVCGTLRRRSLDVAAGRVGADVVATGHNLDDMIQTQLINVLSGDVPRMGRAAGGARARPFERIYEAEIAFYAFANGIPFQAEPCPHMGEGVRTQVREFLNSLERERPGIKNTAARSLERIAGAVEAKKPGACPSCGAPSSGGACSVCLLAGRLRDDGSNMRVPPPGRQ